TYGYGSAWQNAQRFVRVGPRSAYQAQWRFPMLTVHFPCLRLLLILTSLALVIPAVAHAEAPAVGAPAPSFTLTSNEGQPTSLQEYRGKWVVLYFYPKDFTSGCTLEAHNFQQDLAQYEHLNAVILGVSVDTAESHKDFCTKEGLSFKLLSDPEAKVSAQYGS